MRESINVYLLDILSILLPGAVLAALLAHFSALDDLFYQLFQSGTEWIELVAYVGVAYTLGHFVFFLGSFLDDWVFENVKRVFWHDHRLAAYVIKYKTVQTGIEDRAVLNAFKWSCAWLMIHQPNLYASVERHIAESKFFRSLIVVFTIALPLFVINKDFRISALLLLLIILSLVRYLTQRQKSIETAYQFVITASEFVFNSTPANDVVELLNKRNIPQSTFVDDGKPTVCVRTNLKKVSSLLRKILLVLNLCFNPCSKYREKGGTVNRRV